MHHDYRLHHLGWHLYRYGPWTFPLGATPLLIWPIGSSIGLTDSMPIVAIWLKALSPMLPTDFQFIGLWLVLSFALQGVFGALLMRLATPRPELQLLGATLLILSPPLDLPHPARRLDGALAHPRGAVALAQGGCRAADHSQLRWRGRCFWRRVRRHSRTSCS